jgi:hypothetical protein
MQLFRERGLDGTARIASNAVGALGTTGKALNDLSEHASVTILRQRRATPASGGFPQLMRQGSARFFFAAIIPAALALSGCTSNSSSNNSSSNGTFSLSPATATIDTNCTGCNTTNSSGVAVEQYSAMLSGGGAASVTWAVSGGDANAGPGTITTSGQYTPPPYLTANSVQVTVTATLSTNTASKASATLTVTPGFLQPLTPENVALSSAGTVTVTGYIAEAGGSTGINYAVSSSPTGSSGGQGTLGTPSCTRSASAFTYCTVTYSAPATVSSTAATYVVATIGTSSSQEATEVLLNTAGIDSNPATHQVQLSTPISLGSSGGNNNDYDTQGNQIADCCGGTLGSLIQNSSGTQYILSCNHVLARSDQAATGELIVQPGLIDNNCTPNGDGAGTTQVGTLTAWLALSSSTTNADAAIAQVDSGAVNTSGAILELGAVQNGELAAAPPGISSTSGKGETLTTTGLSVAKSGRTTGLTCASVSAINLDVEVSYYKNCAETEAYVTKTYTNQIAVEGNEFSDAGDSGSLVVDSSNAEPVGLFFAGGVTNTGVSEGVANPAPTVLSELGTQQGTTYTFVGTTDHPVSCLNYGNATATAAQGTTLTSGQASRAQQALAAARALVNPSAGILGAATGKSSDHAGEAAVILYVDQSMTVSAPQTVGGVRTEIIPTTPQAVADGTAPQSISAGTLAPLAPAVLSQAASVKQQIAENLMKQNPAFFGVGVGQSFDNPKEASLVVYVDRKQVPASLPATIGGLRVRYIIMDRLHVTRSYLNGPARSQSHCMAHPAAHPVNDPFGVHTLPGLNIF